MEMTVYAEWNEYNQSLATIDYICENIFDVKIYKDNMDVAYDVKEIE